MPDNPKSSKSSKHGLLSNLFRPHRTAPNIGNAVFLAGLSGVAPVDGASTLSSVLEKMPSNAVDLSLAKTGLTLLATLGEGFSGIPGIKAAASIALQIIVAVETAQSNKDACRSVALRVYQTVHAIAKGSQDGREGIQDHIRELENDLSRILDIVQTLTTQKSVLQSTAVAGELVECEKLLIHATTLFSVKVQIHQANVQSQQVSSLEKIIFKLDSQDKPAPLPNLLITASLPPPPTHFVGRDDLVHKGVNHITSSAAATRIAILGQGGIGKTSLSLAILHDPAIQEYFDTQCFFLPCETLKTGHDLVLGILQVLGVSSLDPKQDPLALLYKQLLAVGKSLLVIDNFETPWFESLSRDIVERVLQLVASINSITLIVTMRGNPAPSAVDWTMTLPSEGLGPLSPSAAQAMYLKLSKSTKLNPQSLESLEMLLREVDYVPLAVTLLAALGKTYPPEKLYARWKKNQTELLKAPGSQITKQTSVGFSIDLSLQSSVLIHSPEAFRLLAVIAFLPAGLPHWSDLIDEIMTGFEDVYNAADVLCQTSMVYKTDDGALAMLSPTRHHLNSRKDFNIDKYPDDFKALINFIHQSIDTKSPSLALLGQLNIVHILTKWFELGDPSLTSCGLVFLCSEYLYEKQIFEKSLMELVIPILKSMDDDGQSPLADCIFHYCVLLEGLNYRSQAEEEINTAYEIYTKLGDECGMARVTDFLGFSFAVKGQYEKAIESHMTAYTMFKKLDDWPNLIACLKNWIFCLKKQQKFDEMIEKYQLLIDIADQKQDNDTKAGYLVEIAEILKKQDKTQESIEQYNTAKDIYAALDNKPKVAECLDYIGINLYALQNYEQAIEMHEMAYQILEQLGPHPSICVSLMCLSAIWEAIGYMDKAIEAIAKQYMLLCDGLLEENTSSYQWLMAKCTFRYGMLLFRIQEYKKAIEKLKIAQGLFLRLDDRDQAAICLDEIGVSLNALEDYAQSTEMHSAAYAIFEELNENLRMIQSLKCWKNSLVAQDKYAEAYGIEMKAQLIWINLGDQIQRAISLNYLGEFLCLQEEYSEAIKKHSDALEIFLQLENPRSTAICLGYWGRTCVLQKDYSAAIVKYTEAYDIFSKFPSSNNATMAQYLKEIGFCFEMQGNAQEAQNKYKAAEYLEIWRDWLNSWFVPPYTPDVFS